MNRGVAIKRETKGQFAGHWLVTCQVYGRKGWHSKTLYICPCWSDAIDMAERAKRED